MVFENVKLKIELFIVLHTFKDFLFIFCCHVKLYILFVCLECVGKKFIPRMMMLSG